MREIALLGSTGSIGQNALKIVEDNRKKYRIRSLSAGKNIEILVEQIKRYEPETVCVSDKKDIEGLKSLFPKVKFYYGSEGLLEIVSADSVNTIISAITGTVPLEATLRAMEEGHRICLANKETLVAAGDLINKKLKESKSEIIPIDSEQSAIFQSIGNNKSSAIEKIILTASGGPFYKVNKEDFKKISVKDALKHPTWDMGTKITIDSASLMNKALEIIEAFYLFDLKPDQIDAVIHPQSIIHSMVEFVDSSVIAQLSIPDMRIPILYALSYPDRINFKNSKLKFNELSKLEFFPIDRNKFPSIDFAYTVMEKGKNSGAVFNAANEVAVEYFLSGQVSFTDIFDIVGEALNEIEMFEIDSIDAVLNTIEITKEKTTDIVKKHIRKRS